MTERTNITNLVLLTILAGFLLLSGGLQCAFDSLRPVQFSYKAALRVDSCHQTASQPEQGASCLNKVCHQGSQRLRDLGSPVIHRAHNNGLPMLSNSHTPAPDHRAGQSFIQPPFEEKSHLALLLTSSIQPSQTDHAIRTTVLLM